MQVLCRGAVTQTSCWSLRGGGQPRIPVEWSIVRMPMVVQEPLRGYPDSWLVEYLLEGMRQRFRIVFRHDQCRKAKSNMKSAVGNPEVVDQYLTKEVE